MLHFYLAIVHPRLIELDTCFLVKLQLFQTRLIFKNLKNFSTTEAVNIGLLSKIKSLIWLVITEGINRITFFLLSYKTRITKNIVLHKVGK